MNSVLDFLTELYDSGLGYSALNTARSALSTIVNLPGEHTVGSHPLICRFLKGVFKVRPTLPRYEQTWDTSVVLDYLETLHPVATLSLKDLTLKLVMLTLLVTGQRGQTIHLMDLDYMKQGKQSYTFVIQERIKTTRPGRKQPKLVLTEFRKNSKLCVVKTLQEYIKRTKDIRNSSRLFITYIKPHKEASRDTISRWTKAVMKEAGIDMTVFAAHSTRAASTSKAATRNVPLNTILKTAGWSNENTFTKFYKKQIHNNLDNDFATAVLSK